LLSIQTLEFLRNVVSNVFVFKAKEHF